MPGKEMLDTGRDKPEKCYSKIEQFLKDRGCVALHHPKLDCVGGIDNAYKEIDAKIIEGECKWIRDCVWFNSVCIQIPITFQESKKPGDAVPQLSSYPKPGCPGGFSYLGKLLQRIITGYLQSTKVKERSWRLAQLSILPEVRSQDHYKTCVFFAVIGAVEGRYRLWMIMNKADHVTVPQLSVQDGIYGTKQVPIDPAIFFNWIVEHGVVPESDCPYTGLPQGGHALEEGRLSVVNGYRIINPGEESAENIVAEIMEGGPIVGILLYEPDWHAVSFLHAVMLIGGVYKDERVDKYVIQNSWGPDWEEDGRGLVPISDLVEAYVPVLAEHVMSRELLKADSALSCSM
ncbi:hypothetical protein Peur_000103 [Populus x canadensis]|uniref:uncharacterized protein LOC133699646 n=1 Tax=Populus nigra TaxID=3691 RepID=UPI002B274989|nr:uncharacterized protein LOC133699646 [Populus nigra]